MVKKLGLTTAARERLRSLNRSRGIMAFSGPRYHSHKMKMIAVTGIMTRQAMTDPSDQGFVAPYPILFLISSNLLIHCTEEEHEILTPHSNPRIKQIPKAKTMATPTQSHLSIWGIMCHP
jgi:hypothetical protein